MDDFNTTLCRWYAGEKGGDAFFTAMAGSAESDAARDKWHLLAELERATAARLLAELTARDMPPPDFGERVANAVNRARALHDVSWNAQMIEMKPRLERFVAEIRVARDQAPPDGSAIANDYLAHEQALLDFVDLEIAGRSGTPVVQHLLQGGWPAAEAGTAP